MGSQIFKLSPPISENPKFRLQIVVLENSQIRRERK
ncbi:hypothetical protein ACFX2I_038871 [Malus domestica]